MKFELRVDLFCQNQEVTPKILDQLGVNDWKDLRGEMRTNIEPHYNLTISSNYASIRLMFEITHSDHPLYPLYLRKQKKQYTYQVKIDLEKEKKEIEIINDENEKEIQIYLSYERLVEEVKKAEIEKLKKLISNSEQCIVDNINSIAKEEEKIEAVKNKINSTDEQELLCRCQENHGPCNFKTALLCLEDDIIEYENKIEKTKEETEKIQEEKKVYENLLSEIQG